MNRSEENRSSSAFTSTLSPAADSCVGVAILSVVLLSVLGNGLVLLVCYRRRNKLVGSELLCVNLALADFLVCICFYPFSIISSFSHSWLGGNITCVYYGLGCFFCGLCGMFTVAAISVTRYMKICNSLVYDVWLEESNIRLMCFAIWLVAVVWSCLPLFGWGEYVPEPYGLSCTVAWRGYHSSTKDAFYIICTFTVFALIPVVLIVVSQCLILAKLNRYSYSLSARGIRNNMRYIEKRLSMMFFCVSLGFVIAWAPYAIVSFLFIFHEEHVYMASEGYLFPALFAKSSHIYNPFIYFYFNRTFQKELRHMLRSIGRKLGGNRVSVHVPIEHHFPIHIQLQERRCVRKKRGGVSQDRTRSKSKSKEQEKCITNNQKLVQTCWESTAKEAPKILEKNPGKDIKPVSL
ncbi:opsin 8, group member c [Trematomus bernacchii]|uniref:opsin 8, group member c n=1 Tax=Trematomus bernacchii TaxID=40690 RepID=UPI00146A9A0F|nr:opsin 8, group member c [Trematomus bernacchii]